MKISKAEMETLNYIHLFAAGAGFASGILLILKTLRSELSSNPINPVNKLSSDKEKSKRLVARESNLLALLSDGIVRTKSGFYLRGFWIDAKSSLWGSAVSLDRLYDELSSFLSANFPTGTGFQFRASSHNGDNGVLLKNKVETLSAQGCDQIAQELKAGQIDHLKYLSDAGHFHTNRITLWIYIPTEESDGGRSPLENFGNLLKKDNLKKLLKKDFVSRIEQTELEIIEKSRNYFKDIENFCPLEAIPMSREETWQALYYGYNENALSHPPSPVSAFSNLEPLLCSSESIKHSNNWYLLHGNTPVAMISMFVPPESNDRKRGCFAGMMRHLTNSGLNGRFTVVTDFITEDNKNVKKQLARSKWKIGIASNRPTGTKKTSKENQAAYQQIDEIEQELVSQTERIVKMRFYILLYGHPAKTLEELDKSTNKMETLIADILKKLRRFWRGAELALEEAYSLRELYQTTLLGNMPLGKNKTGRELFEQSSSFCTFIPAEKSWEGMTKPHSLKKSLTGEVFGINFWNNPLTKTPLVCVLGAPGTGKSVEIGAIINDVLANIPEVRVNAVDFGETYAPLCEVLEGTQLRYSPDEERTINIWDYEGLESGEYPDEVQLNLVVEDTSILAGFDPVSESGRVKKGILYKCVKEVYKDIVPRNRQLNSRRIEPTLSDLIGKLQFFNFETGEEVEQAAQLASILSIYEKNPWLDAPTSDYFRNTSRFVVYELDSLFLFPREIRAALAFRTGSRVIRAIGKKKNNMFGPVLNIFDEMHEYNDSEQTELQTIFRAIEKGGRKGRKTGVVTILATHGYEDLFELHGLTKTAGVFIIGKQDDVSLLKKTRHWNDEIEAAVMSVESQAGSFSQFVINAGLGDNQKTEIYQSDLSSEMLWALTSDPNERNAREEVKKYFPQYTTFDAVKYLANIYPRGLTFSGKTKIDRIHLPQIDSETQINDLEEINSANKPNNPISNENTAEIGDISQYEHNPFEGVEDEIDKILDEVIKI